MKDYLLAHPTTQATSVPVVLLPTLWSVLMDGLAPIWPASRTAIGGVSLGDAWPLSTMPTSPTTKDWETIVPFHKLTQWLCYSLMQPMTKIMHIHFAGAELMTGLPEYRNGGLFIDTGVLTLKPADEKRGLKRFEAEGSKNGKTVMEVVPMFTPEDDVVVEWRAVTVGFLDLLLDEVNLLLGLQGNDQLSLVQMLEAGSWKVSSSLTLLLNILTSSREAEKWPRSQDQTRNVHLSRSFPTAPSSDSSSASNRVHDIILGRTQLGLDGNVGALYDRKRKGTDFGRSVMCAGLG